MSITSDLRGFALACDRQTKKTLLMAADRIDAEVADMQAFCDRLRDAAERREDVTLWGVDYTALPVDADGVPWYRGSRVIDPKDPDGKVNTVWIAGDNTLITDEHVFIFRANELRHYHEPTVEDVLREFHERMDELGTTDQCVGTARADAVDALLRERAELFAEYAAKLRLRGEDE